MQDLLVTTLIFFALTFLAIIAVFISSFIDDTATCVTSMFSFVFAVILGACVVSIFCEYNKEECIRKTVEQTNICIDTATIEKCKVDTTVQYILVPIYQPRP